MMAQIFDCRDCGREVRVTLSDDAEIVGVYEFVQILCGICIHQHNAKEEASRIERQNFWEKFTSDLESLQKSINLKAKKES